MSEPDAELVRRAQQGDAAAFDSLVRRYFRAVYAIALAETRNSRDAEDVSQDTMLRALERLDDCRQPDRFNAWLFRIARNSARSHGRRESVRAAAPLEVALNASGNADPARDTERSQLRDRLTTALATLTAIQREVVLLHDLEQWKHREIAEVLGIPEGTVRSHLFFARRALRTQLGGTAYAEDAHGSGTD